MALSFLESTIDNKLTASYGSIYAGDNAVAQTIANGASYVKIINFDGNGIYSNCTPDYSNNKITITLAGKYEVMGSFSIESDTNSINIFGTAFLDDVEQNHIHFKRTIANINDTGSACFSGDIEVTSVPVDLDFRVRHDNGTSIDLTLPYMNIKVKRIDV